ncbi:MAG: hypothetical protein KatS3mg011_2388 [Acidimicrobiia bacterium]|nr:MAG: hypothetical protein KatS3mg011_2388 [Acidimicrobiia bacterium]
MRIVEAIAPDVVDYYAFCGTVEQVAEEIRLYEKAGLRHLVMWNITPFGDAALSGWSFKALRQLPRRTEGALSGTRGCLRSFSDYFDAINREDWDKLASLWVEDAELRVVGARPRKGRDDVLGYYPRALALYPEHHDDPYRISVAGEVVTVEIAFRGKTADGKEVPVRGGGRLRPAGRQAVEDVFLVRPRPRSTTAGPSGTGTYGVTRSCLG